MNHFGIMRSQIQQRPKRIGYEGAAPKLLIGFAPNPIHRHHRNTIGNGMAPLNGLPRTVLLVVGGGVSFVGIPTNGSGVKQDLGPHQRRNSGRFGIPLIPANKYPDFGHFRLKNLITGVTW